MKAKIIATGEIIELSPTEKVFDKNAVNQYRISELEEVSVFTSDYWARLEHTYAGMAMQGLLTNSNLIKILRDENVTITERTHVFSEWAKMYAHALVEKLKKEE